MKEKNYKLTNRAVYFDEYLPELGFTQTVFTQKVGQRAPSYGLYLDVFERGPIKIEITSDSWVTIYYQDNAELNELKQQLQNQGFEFKQGAWIDFYKQ